MSDLQATPATPDTNQAATTPPSTPDVTQSAAVAAPAGAPAALSTPLPADELDALAQLVAGLQHLPSVTGSETHSLRQVLIAGFNVVIDQVKALRDRVDTLERLTID
ncbi:hypothetical protein [Burkholderia ubonensis]|uniref:hypothetical protein n=1 Tax=Burkholderia ubonensis TaxID=101571 RepID=UPI0011602494|nr:hypothetical protein [Burkholderia ubonensis]